MQNKTVTIIGAGLVGTLWSIFLARKDYAVKLYDKRSDIRTGNAAAGKSINMALSDRGWKALELVGLTKTISDIAIPMYGRRVHKGDSEHFLPYGKDNQAIHSVSRSTLNEVLLTEAEQAGVEIYFDYAATDVDFKNRVIRFDHNGQEIQTSFELLFGADGAYAATRLSHQTQQYPFDYQQFYINCCYKELHIPAKDGNFALPPNALHIWPGHSFMLIALPNLDYSFTCTLFMPATGEHSFEQLKSDADVLSFFKEHFTSAVPLMPTLLQDFKQNPTSHLVTVKCFPWIQGDYFSLLGDAAHAIVPFFGQGMNCGFEDCRILSGMVDEYEHDWGRILPAFQTERKPNADAIAALAIENFIEMSSKVADPDFVLQKQIEQYLHREFPDRWVPAYSLVTFSPEVSYADALRKGQTQNAIMQEVIKSGDLPENLEDISFLKSIIDRLPEKD